MRVSVRRASRSDAPEFLELLLAFARFSNLEPPTAEAQKRVLEDIFVRKRIRLLMAYNGGLPVGYTLYFYTYSSFLARPTLYLEDVFISDQHRILESEGRSSER